MFRIAYQVEMHTANAKFAPPSLSRLRHRKQPSYGLDLSSCSEFSPILFFLPRICCTLYSYGILKAVRVHYLCIRRKLCCSTKQILRLLSINRIPPSFVSIAPKREWHLDPGDWKRVILYTIYTIVDHTQLKMTTPLMRFRRRLVGIVFKLWNQSVDSDVWKEKEKCIGVREKKIQLSNLAAWDVKIERKTRFYIKMRTAEQTNRQNDWDMMRNRLNGLRMGGTVGTATKFISYKTRRENKLNRTMRCTYWHMSALLIRTSRWVSFCLRNVQNLAWPNTIYTHRSIFD